MGVVLNLAQTKDTRKSDRRPPPAKEKEPFSKQSEEPSRPSIGEGRSVLIVDDNPVVLKAFDLKLKANGFKVATTTDSASVAKAAELAHAELIILDINFHSGGGVEWNGFTVMQWLNRFPELGSIPVIMITGSEAESYREKAIKAGAVALLQKPIDFKEVLELIVKTLAGKSRGS